MKLTKFVLLASLSVSSSACFQFNTLVHLRPDGSGTIEQRVMFTKAAVEQLKQLAGVAGSSPDNATFDPLSEEAARDMANQLGPGVTYVSSTPVQTAEGEGRDVIFAFDDIRAVNMSQRPPGADAVTADPTALHFTLSRTPAGNTVLQIGMPAGPGAAAGSAGRSTGVPDLPPAAQMAMLKPLLAGAHITIALEPMGRLIRTNSPYVDGNRVTLLELDLDQLLADDTLLAKIQAAPDGATAQELIANVPGVKFVAAPEITVEFAP